MRPSFDLEGLRAMIIGVDLGSFARAAVQLGRSQSAVSMQLKRLEEQAGHPLFQRSGRGLVPTEAGEALLPYARRLVALHDEAGVALGATKPPPAIRLGLPQDFFEDIMPDALASFAEVHPITHVAVRAGRNYALEGEVKAGRLDVALAFAEPGHAATGELLATLPMHWYGCDKSEALLREGSGGIPLVLFDHPCLFRQAALRALDAERIPWRLSLTTPSLPGVWAALRFGLGVTVRTTHAVPPEMRKLDGRLPRLPPLELRMLIQASLSGTAGDLIEILRTAAKRRLSEVVAAQIEHHPLLHES